MIIMIMIIVIISTYNELRYTGCRTKANYQKKQGPIYSIYQK